ncbi:4Fe-4S dicluster domain-containing protein [Desulfohalobium retbaense]|uniref:4Fe-4S ferredoxin iron-sulfur binding domain protein n=1 Tax=Desulfohalobium retbaense (strain ATCC 49708 / DSM 5692 / JCM 16813 / HR100) TaxID=485915 RepID=C8X2P3_DESRD|nr:4Fe-4S dicluster domain-containing protein [Desulfohalobium retbaense]ACV68690.1 4Fe-4S ferredoxin iron-sulfur binding domain protein [Desulfohalobium retbaense DSM 5692]
MPKKPKKGNTKVWVYPDWCKGCGLCVAFCPGKVLELNEQGKAEVVHPEECINCGFCELHCPDFAIVVTPKEGAEQETAPQAHEGQTSAAPDC